MLKHWWAHAHPQIFWCWFENHSKFRSKTNQTLGKLCIGASNPETLGQRIIQVVSVLRIHGEKWWKNGLWRGNSKLIGGVGGLAFGEWGIGRLMIPIQYGRFEDPYSIKSLFERIHDKVVAQGNGHLPKLTWNNADSVAVFFRIQLTIKQETHEIWKWIITISCWLHFIWDFLTGLQLSGNIFDPEVFLLGS